MFVMVSARFVGSSYILTSTLSIQASLFFFLPYSHSISAAFVSNRYRYQSYMRTMRSNFGILRSIIAYTSVSSQLLNIKVWDADICSCNSLFCLVFFFFHLVPFVSVKCFFFSHFYSWLFGNRNSVVIVFCIFVSLPFSKTCFHISTSSAAKGFDRYLTVRSNGGLNQMRTGVSHFFLSCTVL